MKRSIPTSLVLLSLGIFLQPGPGSSQVSALGLFEAHGDVGAVGKPGSVEYDAARKSYLVAGGGENMWLASDAVFIGSILVMVAAWMRREERDQAASDRRAEPAERAIRERAERLAIRTGRAPRTDI